MRRSAERHSGLSAHLFLQVVYGSCEATTPHLQGATKNKPLTRQEERRL